MQPDIEKYLSLFEGDDLTEEEKIEYIHTLWKITGAFAYRAFGLDSVQLVCNGKDRTIGRKSGGLIESKDRPLSETFARLKADND